MPTKPNGTYVVLAPMLIPRKLRASLDAEVKRRKLTDAHASLAGLIRELLAEGLEQRREERKERAR